MKVRLTTRERKRLKRVTNRSRKLAIAIKRNRFKRIKIDISRIAEYILVDVKTDPVRIEASLVLSGSSPNIVLKDEIGCSLSGRTFCLPSF